MQAWLDSLMALLALPQYGLSTLFVAAFVSATLLPVGSEPERPWVPQRGIGNGYGWPSSMLSIACWMLGVGAGLAR